MSDPIDQIISDVIMEEGSTYTNREGDRGGPTKFGITLATYSDFHGKPMTAEDVENMTEDEARAIYRKRYVTDPGFDKINDQQLAELVIDCGVQHGTDRALKWLQTYAGVPADGAWGHETEAAVNRHDPRRLRALVIAARIAFYGHLVSADHTQAVNAGGWANRMVPYIQRLA